MHWNHNDEHDLRLPLIPDLHSNKNKQDPDLHDKQATFVSRPINWNLKISK